MRLNASWVLGPISPAALAGEILKPPQGQGFADLGRAEAGYGPAQRAPGLGTEDTIRLDRQGGQHMGRALLARLPGDQGFPVGIQDVQAFLQGADARGQAATGVRAPDHLSADALERALQRAPVRGLGPGGLRRKRVPGLDRAQPSRSVGFRRAVAEIGRKKSPLEAGHLVQAGAVRRSHSLGHDLADLVLGYLVRAFQQNFIHVRPGLDHVAQERARFRRKPAEAVPARAAVQAAGLSARAGGLAVGTGFGCLPLRSGWLAIRFGAVIFKALITVFLATSFNLGDGCVRPLGPPIGSTFVFRPPGGITGPVAVGFCGASDFFPGHADDIFPGLRPLADLYADPVIGMVHLGRCPGLILEAFVYELMGTCAELSIQRAFAACDFGGNQNVTVGIGGVIGLV